MDQNDFITPLDLSRACVQYLGSLLKGSGRSTTQAAIADFLGVSQSMISRVVGDTQPTSFSLEVLHACAEKLGVPVPDFWRDIAQLAVEEKPVRPHVNDEDLPARAFAEVEFLKRHLLNDKKSDDCKADEFYKRTVWRLHKQLLGHGVVATALCFRHCRHCTLFAAHGECRGFRQVAQINSDVPSSLVGAVDKAWACDARAPLVSDCIVYRPTGETNDPHLGFWENFTGSPAPAHRQRLRVSVARVYHRQEVVSEETAVEAYTITLLCVFGGGTEPSHPVHRAMWLFADVAHRIHSIELQGHADSVARLWGVTLLPADVRPHRNFYRGDAVPDHLEAVVQSFFGQISQLPDLCGRVGTMDIWTYDWTRGEFSCLSPYFRFVNAELGERHRIVVHGIDRPLKEVYEEAVKSMKPRRGGKQVTF